MRLRQDQHGFVLSGIALLLVLPAMLLVASLLSMVEIGGETTSLQSVADKVIYTGYDLERILKYMDNKGLPVDNKSLGYLADNYSASTGLLLDMPGVLTYPIWIRVQTGAEHYPGTKYCRVAEISPGVWEYGFEDLDEGLGENPDWDYNEPRLLVEKIGDNIRITFLGYDGGYWSDVYYSSTRIFRVYRDASLQPAIVENALKLHVPAFLRDPRGAAWFSTTVELV